MVLGTRSETDTVIDHGIGFGTSIGVEEEVVKPLQRGASQRCILRDTSFLTGGMRLPRCRRAE